VTLSLDVDVVTPNPWFQHFSVLENTWKAGYSVLENAGEVQVRPKDDPLIRAESGKINPTTKSLLRRGPAAIPRHGSHELSSDFAVKASLLEL